MILCQKKCSSLDIMLRIEDTTHDTNATFIWLLLNLDNAYYPLIIPRFANGSSIRRLSFNPQKILHPQITIQTVDKCSTSLIHILFFNLQVELRFKW